MTTFEYLAVLFSVVVGLAVAQTLRGVLRIVQHRRTMHVYWPTIIWTAAVLQWAIFFWWFSGATLAQLQEWHLTTLLFLLAYASALYFLLGLLHPDDAGPGFDMRAHFEANRVWFFGIFLGLGLLDVGDTWFKLSAGLSELEGRRLVEYLVFLVAWVLGALACIRVKSSRFVGAVGAFYFLVTFYIAIQVNALGPFLKGN